MSTKGVTETLQLSEAHKLAVAQADKRDRTNASVDDSMGEDKNKNIVEGHSEAMRVEDVDDEWEPDDLDVPPPLYVRVIEWWSSTVWSRASRCQDADNALAARAATAYVLEIQWQSQEVAFVTRNYDDLAKAQEEMKGLPGNPPFLALPDTVFLDEGGFTCGDSNSFYLL